MSNDTYTDAFWGDIANVYVDWIKPWQTIRQGSFEQGDLQWFPEGRLNVSLNCIDRHLQDKANQAAIIWEGDNEGEQRTLTFVDLHQEVCRMANVLRELGIRKGDRVGIYLPMIPEVAISMLACARIGAVHTVVFAGFSALALRQRMEASEAKVIITADGYFRGGKFYTLKSQVDEACHGLHVNTLIIQNSNTPVAFDAKKDFWWHELRARVSDQCDAEEMAAEDPLFILYTSGSTGKPKGLIHSSGGYLVQTAFTHQKIFQCTDDEVFWCTADAGWITGHSYVVYGPLCNGITTLMFAGIPTWPNPSRCWQIIDRHKVRVFYTAPTAIRALKREGDTWLHNSSRESLRLLGTVGEPINPDAWNWYFEQVGNKRCPITDTWWQTETGAAMISPQNGLLHQKPGCAGQPLPNIFPVLLDDLGQEIEGVGEGALAIKYPWPSIARTIAGDHQRYKDTYLHGGYYITGDGARRDAEGDFWISGRIDDVLNVSGHRLGTAEIESALVSHPDVAEAAVVGTAHPLKGQGIHAFVSLKANAHPSDTLQMELMETVKLSIGAIAKPDMIQCVADLPKTRSGKIMRRLLRLIAGKKATSMEDLGDLSTLSNPQVIEDLLKQSPG